MGINNVSIRMLISAAACIAIAVGIVEPASAFPNAHWSVEPGDRFEVIRSHGCFDEGRGADESPGDLKRVKIVPVNFNREVVEAEAFLSGFSLEYTRDGHDHEVVKDRVDVIVNKIGGYPIEPEQQVINKNRVWVKLIYTMVDQDPKGENDYNKACIGFTVIAKTK